MAQAQMQKDVILMNMEQQLSTRAQEKFGKELKNCDDKEVYVIVLEPVKELAYLTGPIEGEKKS